MQAIDHALVVDVEVEGVVRARRVVRVATLRLLPRDDRSPVYSMSRSPSAIGCDGEHALAMHAGCVAPGCRAWPRSLSIGWFLRVFAPSISFGTLNSWVRARVTCARRSPDCIDAASAARERHVKRMTKSLIIAEKPSVAQDIVRALTPSRGQVREARRVLRERRVRRHLGRRPPGGDQGAGGVRRQARQVELRPPAGDPAALRPGAARQDQERG